MTSMPASPQTNFSELPSFYEEEFKKIRESQESYKGKWNWWAFVFTVLWGFKKGGWLIAVVAMLTTICTFGIASPIWWFLYGYRGTWMYYNVYAKSKQVPLKISPF